MEYKFSIISPSHKNTPYLQELYESLVTQTYGNWEWILWLNGKFDRKKLSAEIENDERVKIYQCKEKNSNVGFHKNKAFHLGTGDILVEVDHDDMITPDWLDAKNSSHISSYHGTCNDNKSNRALQDKEQSYHHKLQHHYTQNQSLGLDMPYSVLPDNLE